MSPPTRSQLCHTIKCTAPGSLRHFESPKCEGIPGHDGTDAYKEYLRVQQTSQWPSAIMTHLNHASPEMLSHPSAVHSSVISRPLDPRNKGPTVFRFKSSLATPRGRNIVTTRFLDYAPAGMIELKEPCTLLENSLYFMDGTRELTAKYSVQWKQAAGTIHALMTDYGYTKPKCESIVERMEGDVTFAGLTKDALMITFWPPPIPTHSGDSVQTFLRWDFTKDGLTNDIPESRAWIPSSRSGS